MPSQYDQVACLNERINVFRQSIKVILARDIHIHVSDQAAKLFLLESCESGIKVRQVDIPQDTLQLLHIPLPADLIHGDIECLLLRLREINGQTFCFRLAEIIQH